MRGDCSGNPQLQRAAPPRAKDRDRCLYPPGAAVRAAGRGARTFARPHPESSVLGHAGVAEHAARGARRFDQVGIESVPMQTGIAKFDLTLNVNARGDDLVVTDRVRCRRCSMPRPSSAWPDISGCCSRPRPIRGDASASCRCSARPSAASAVAEWNDTDTDYPRDAAFMRCSRSRRAHARRGRARVRGPRLTMAS